MYKIITRMKTARYPRIIRTFLYFGRVTDISASFSFFFNFRVKIKSISLEVESFSKQNFSTNQNAVYLLSDWSEIVVFDLLNKMFGRSD